MSNASNPPSASRPSQPQGCSFGLGCLLIAILSVIVLLGGAKVVVQHYRTKAAPDQVRAVLDAQVEAWNRGDLEGFMAGYWGSDELEFRSGGTVTKGWQATLDRYRKRYQAEGKEMGRLSFSDVEVEAFGPGAAMVRGRYRLVTTKDTFEGLFTLLFRPFTDGWKIVYDHTSAADPPKKSD